MVDQTSHLWLQKTNQVVESQDKSQTHINKIINQKLTNMSLIESLINVRYPNLDRTIKLW